MENIKRSPYRLSVLQRLKNEGPLTQADLTDVGRQFKSTAESRRQVLHKMSEAGLILLKPFTGPNRSHVWTITEKGLTKC